jgi:peptidoglycan/xylan/chitin deacetylase (PgdA/CDA1 family)
MDALRAFAHGFAAGHYGAMWAWLAPAAQSDWDGPTGFAAYYRAKFAPVRLLGLRFGAPQVAGRVVQAPLSLDLAWRGAGIPGVLPLFQNLEATVVQTPQGWRVAEGGPLDPAAPVIPPPRVAPRVRRVPILMYHHISSAPPAPSQAGLTITDPQFAAQLAYLKGHDYHAVLLVDLFNALDYGRPLPPHPVVLTFDDGYLDAYTDALPLLRRYGMVGEFNIITGFVGKTIGVNRYMTWPQIVAMAGAGMEMESHTIDHQDLGIIDAPQDAYELRFSRAVLAAHIHRAVQFLAYPAGEPFRSGTLVAQQRLLALLPRCGYVGALLDPPTPSTVQDARTPYQLPRVRVDPRESLAVFAASLQS